MSLYTRLVRPLLFQVDSERAHNLSIRIGEWAGHAEPVRAMLARHYAFNDPRLASDVCGLHFANPLGLAAGYDKNGRALSGLAALGFGFLEVGSVSADPSTGNPGPRLWRLPSERAVVVNYGLPNEGAPRVAERMAATHLEVPVGLNIVKTNNRRADPDEEIIDDYLRSVRLLKDSGEYLVLNLSCPNTETGCNFFAEPKHIAWLLQTLADEDIARPLFLKVSPLGGVEAIEPRRCLDVRVDVQPPPKII